MSSSGTRPTRLTRSFSEGTEVIKLHTTGSLTIHRTGIKKGMWEYLKQLNWSRIGRFRPRCCWHGKAVSRLLARVAHTHQTHTPSLRPTSLCAVQRVL